MINETEKIAKVFELAAKIREDSYDTEAANRLKSWDDTSLAYFESFYKMTIHDAVKQSMKELDLDENMFFIVYTMLNNYWNDVADWAGR